MNRPKRDMTADDDRRFDLLVDGELSPAERRELLGNLDDEPGAWRRCALAFLEAQAWREDFGAPRDQAAASDAPSSATKPSLSKPRRGGWALRTGGTLLAMAASFLVAMALGWWVYGPQGAQDLSPMAPVEVAEKTADPRGPALDPAKQLAHQVPGIPREPHPTPSEALARWRWVTLAPEPGLPGDARPLRLPAVEAEAVDDGWLRHLPSGVSAEVLDALRQAGHRVRHQRQLVPFPLEDGRSLLVPVDEVDVHYVGNELYQ